MKEYKIKSFIGAVGDLDFEWDIDGSQRAKHEEYIKKVKLDGTYGKEYEASVFIEENKVFDESSIKDVKLTSYQGLIIDFSENNNK